MKQLSARPALITIDVQQGFHDSYWGKRSNPQAEGQIAALLAAWRQRNLPIFHVQHLSLQPESPLYYQKPEGIAFMDCMGLQPDEDIVQKNVNSAFIGTNLEQKLRAQSIESVVIIGFSTQHCISTTTRMSGNLGFHTFVVSDATAAFDVTGPNGVYYPADTVHDVSLATLHREFAEVITTEELLRRLTAL
ncbi:cysteine hydrolase family protein [Ectobacillus ponti]|uniref:Cysteine hydrolase n=1 Tax=Ectobacillus ponti TaxID=2961894 RepID=A0AA41XDA2_9BACI|nr:cysteine hydrolase family protein [Ectobacillus ponti]MCP8970770.1 cysteine hydrolase [Ectobacillus ponti]